MIALNLETSASIHTVTSGYFMFSSVLVVQCKSNQSVSVYDRNKSCIWDSDMKLTRKLFYFLFPVNFLRLVVIHINENWNIVMYKKVTCNFIPTLYFEASTNESQNVSWIYML